MTAAHKGENIARRSHRVLPVTNISLEDAVSEVKKDEMGDGTKDAYRVLRDARSEARLVGVREKRAKAKAEDKENSSKK